MASETSKKIRTTIGVTITSLNLREEPDKDSDILYVIPENSAVVVLKDENEEFYKVQVLGVIGYCVKEFIKIKV